MGGREGGREGGEEGEREGGRGDDTSILLAGSICVSFYIHTVCPRIDHFRAPKLSTVKIIIAGPTVSLGCVHSC